MRKYAVRCLLLLSIFLLSLSAFAQTGKVEPLGELSDPAVPDPVKKVLDKKGSRVILDDGSTLCDIWLRTQLAPAAKKGPSDALYPQVGEATLFGVISFPKAATDFRGQAIAPGFYTLRYELSPDDGNHLGVSQFRDFLLLISASHDPDPDKALSFDEMMTASRSATGTKHPGPLSLLEATGNAGPAVAKNAEGYWVFSDAVKLASGDNLPFALVVKGSAPQ